MFKIVFDISLPSKHSVSFSVTIFDWQSYLVDSKIANEIAEMFFCFMAKSECDDGSAVSNGKAITAIDIAEEYQFR